MVLLCLAKTERLATIIFLLFCLFGIEACNCSYGAQIWIIVLGRCAKFLQIRVQVW